MYDPEKSPYSGWVKNKADFLFKISKESGVQTTDRYTFASSCKKIKIFLNGVIYNNSEEQLIDGFSSHGADYINNVEGSFVIFLIEGPQFHILTDKVNSKKAFYAFLDNVWYVSNNIDALPKLKCKLSLAGLACYLANGVMLNDLTLFQEIKSAKRASVHSINNNTEISIRTYWNYQFEYSSSINIEQQQYQNELESLLFNSIIRRYSSVSKIAVSLSGGYDSRGILGILFTKIKASNISCFSYALTENPKTDSDAHVAIEIAAKCEYPLQILESYQGNLIEQLIANAREGKCISDFCIELDAWHHLAASNQFSDLFVGDQCFGHDHVWVEESKEEILQSLEITGTPGIRWLKQLISESIYQQMFHSLNKLMDDIYLSTKAIPDPFDKQNFLYLDQRINHALMPWREYFCSQVGFVHNPFLDGDVLEFVKKLSPKMRRDYSLYRNTIMNLLPGLFSIKLAKSSDFNPDWREELDKHKEALISLIQGTESRLDEIVPKKQIIKALKKEVSMNQKVKTFLRMALNPITKRHKFAEKVLNRFLGQQVIRSKNATQLLLRLLLIRIYLSPSLSDN